MDVMRHLTQYGPGSLIRGEDGAGVRARIDVPVASFAFPAIESLDERVTVVLAHAAGVRGLKPSTCSWARACYRTFRTFLGREKMDARFVTGHLNDQIAILETWIADMRGRSLSRVAINSAWRGLSSVFRWISHPDGLVNPMLFVEQPRAGRVLPRVLRKEAAEELVRFVRNFPWRTALEARRNLAIIGLMLLAGLRRSEVARVEVGDVDLRGGTIRIRGGKGRHGGRDRTAYVSPQLGTVLSAYVAERTLAGRTHAELMTHAARNHGIHPGTINLLCRKIASASGIPVRPHALRHTFATLLRQEHVDDRVAMELMGHTSLAALQRYSHVFSEEPGRAVASIRLDGL